MERDLLIRSLVAFALDASAHDEQGWTVATLVLRHRNAESMLPQVRAHLVRGGRVSAAGQTLRVQTTADNLDDIRALVAAADLPARAR